MMGKAGHGCMRCGSDDVEVRRPGRAEGLRDWLRFGGRWRPSSQVCRRCGHVRVAGSAWYLARRRGWWSVAVGLVRLLRQRRTMVPAPATYLVAVAAGTVLGAAAQLALGWPWWLVAAAAPAAVWLFFSASAFRGGRRTGRPLATEVLLLVDPARGVQRERRAMEAQFRAAPLPLYGLPGSWAGLRHLGGYGHRHAKGSGPVVTSMSLAHGDPLAEHGPELRVEVRADPGEPARTPGATAELRQFLADDLRWSAAVAARQGAGQGPWSAPDTPGSAWSEVTIPVDGRPVAFAWLAEGRHWVAHAELEDRTLVLSARDLPLDQVALVRVTDVEPYLDGTRRLEQARARHLGRDH
jgi:hypothetical protein